MRYVMRANVTALEGDRLLALQTHSFRAILRGQGSKVGDVSGHILNQCPLLSYNAYH
jgi:hypothetical protein